MTSETSGWYARLDHECPERTQQIEIWLDSWLDATKKGLPIVLPSNNWPTLPAGLLNLGTVLDHLIVFDAQSMGVPRGSLRTSTFCRCRTTSCAMEEVRRTRLHFLAALPPSFRGFAKQINENIMRMGTPKATVRIWKIERCREFRFRLQTLVWRRLFVERILRYTLKDLRKNTE